MTWPGNKIDLANRLSEATESQRRAFLAELASESPESKETQEKGKEKPGEAIYECSNGVLPLLWHQHSPDGPKTFISFKSCNLQHQRSDKEKLEAFVTNIEDDTANNTNYRQVIFTSESMQLVLMSISNEIGEETHPNTDQFIRIESGTGQAIIDGEVYEISAGSALVIPAGSRHNIVSNAGHLRLYTIYSPPHHPKDTTQKHKP